MFYVLSVALILAGCLVFYKLLLQKETFFPLNRFVLLACLALSFSLPLIPVPQQWSFRKANVETPLTIEESVKVATVATVPQPSVAETKASIDTKAEKESFFKDISLPKVLFWAYWLGVIVFGINFIFQLCVLLYRAYSRPVIKDGRFRIVELSGNQAPCSFGNNIFINPEKYDWDTYNQIILHEKIHIQQGHSYDILIAELALVFQWFNPFAWMYRKAMEDNLEFLTDNELLANSDIEPTSYQMSLVKVSAPHFPASLTTNYNQSILKKRLVMMNAKKSNVNSTWKYLFIVPLLLVFIAFLNEPKAYGKNDQQVKKSQKIQSIDNEGTWFATIKGDKVNIRFESGEDGKNNSNHTFSLAELKNLPRETSGTFSLTREAGTMNFTGKFEGDAGMGKYKFSPDASFNDFLTKEGVTGDDNDLVFFLINAKKEYVKSLKALGYNKISKGELIPLVALNVSPEYIKSLRSAGLDDVSLGELIPLKALDVDAKFIAGIKDAGYKDLSAGKMITFKSQGITGEYLKNIKAANAESLGSEPTATAKNNKVKPAKRDTKQKDNDDDEFDKVFGNVIAKKVLNITPEYAKSFAVKGLKVSDDNLLAFKSLGITPEFYEGFKAAGLNVTDEQLLSMKPLNVTPNDIVEFKKLGFKDISIDDLISAKATGTSPVFVASMKKKGHNYKSIEDYIKMKVLSLD